MQKIIFTIFGCLFLFVIAFSCSNKDLPEEKPIARVYDEYLYLSDMKEVLSEAKNATDSQNLIKNFTDKWAKKQVQVHLAEANLSDEGKDVSRELENYRASLLIYKYQQLFVSQKLDTVISDQEFEKYFSEHANDFKLDRTVVKANYIKLPKSVPNLDKFKKLYSSKSESDASKMYEYCSKYAFDFKDFDNNWISFDNIQSLLPKQVSDINSFVQSNKSIEQLDSNYYYFVKIKEYELEGANATFEFAKPFISSIILSNRKVLLLNKLEYNTFQEELSKKNVEFFKN